MPITKGLSRKLHETFGDEAAAEMVNWMNRVEGQRAEWRELNELNFARIDARFGQVDARLNAIDARFGEIDARFNAIDTRFNEIDARFNEMNVRFTGLESSIVSRLEAKIEQRTADLMKWSFVFWVGAVGAVAILAGVLR